MEEVRAFFDITALESPRAARLLPNLRRFHALYWAYLSLACAALSPWYCWLLLGACAGALGGHRLLGRPVLLGGLLGKPLPPQQQSLLLPCALLSVLLSPPAALRLLLAALLLVLAHAACRGSAGGPPAGAGEPPAIPASAGQQDSFRATASALRQKYLMEEVQGHQN